MAGKPTSTELATIAALAPIAEEIRNRKPGVISEDNWNPDHHIEITLRVRECQAIIRLLEWLKKRTEAGQ